MVSQLDTAGELLMAQLTVCDGLGRGDDEAARTCGQSWAGQCCRRRWCSLVALVAVVVVA